jgi:predicted transcriptional regulator YdeE/DNA-binding transcriptional MerR regulator
MIKIGDFAKLANVTIKALRHYAALDLLRPVWTDRYSGYRYYTLEQLPRLNRILALKEMGFSLDQVRTLLDGELTAEQLRQMFNHKQAELEQHVQAEQDRLRRVAARLETIEQEGRLPAYEVTLKAAPALAVASLRSGVAAQTDLSARSLSMRAQIRAWLERQRLPPSHQWLVRYHAAPAGSAMELEVAAVLEDPPRRLRAPAAGRPIGLEVLPAVESLACILQRTGERPLPEAYTALYAWLERNRYHTTGPAREVMLDDPAQPESPWRFTEVQLPVQSNQVYRDLWIANPNRKEDEMEPKYVTRPAFTVVGMRYYGKNENQEIAQLWRQANPRLGEIQHVTGECAYGLCCAVEGAAPGEFEYVAGLEVTDAEPVPAGMVARQVPPQQYAVFTHVGGLDKLRDTYHYIYQTWLPQSGRQLTGGPDFELYDQDFKDFAPDSRFYIYVPVK